MITDAEIKAFIRTRMFDMVDFWGQIDGKKIGLTIFGSKFLLFQDGVWQQYTEIPNIQIWLSLDISWGLRVQEYVTGPNAPEKCTCMLAICCYFPIEVFDSIKENWVKRIDESFRYIFYRSFRVESSARVDFNGFKEVPPALMGANSSLSSLYSAIALNYNCFYLSARYP